MTRKILSLLLLVFTVSFFIGFSGKRVDAASNCYYRCICSEAYKCCRFNGVETCKRVFDSPISCPQVAC
jgi:hypothetical protein